MNSSGEIFPELHACVSLQIFKKKEPNSDPLSYESFMFLSPQREETVCVVRVKVLDHLVTERGTLCSLMLDPSIREASGQSCFLVHSPVANV